MSIKLKGSSDGSVSFDAPADTSPSGSDITLTLPTSAGSANQFLKNSGIAGELEYSSMVENSTGVGIGTTSPNSLLSVKVSASRQLDVVKDSGDDNLVLKSTAPDSSNNLRTIELAGERVAFSTGASSGTTYTERMRIDSSGNVGINDTTPDARLDIGGDNADIRLGGSQYFRIKALSTGELTFNDNDTNERMRITSGGNIAACGANGSVLVGAGNTSTGFVIESAGGGTEGALFISRAATQVLYLNRNNNGSIAGFSRSGTGVGSISVTSSATAYNTSSDYRLKENVVDLDGAIDRVKQLAPKRFNFIVDADTTVDGFLAHEAQAVVPEAVTGTHNEVDDDGNAVMQGIDQSKLVPLLTAALQEAIAKIETLETKVAALEAA